MDHASRNDHNRRSGTNSSPDRTRNSKSASPRKNLDPQTRALSIPPTVDPPEELDINSGDEANVTQPDTEAAADLPAVTSSTIAVSQAKSRTEVVSAEAQEIELESDILEVFGERLRPARVLVLAVHSHLATLWFEIIERGLPAEEQKIFLMKLSPSQNCVFIDPPNLNLEVKVALDSTIIKRDERIVEKQEKVAASLAGGGKVIDLLIKSYLAD